jgi:hypothetical protein
MKIFLPRFRKPRGAYKLARPVPPQQTEQATSDFQLFPSPFKKPLQYIIPTVVGYYAWYLDGKPLGASLFFGVTCMLLGELYHWDAKRPSESRSFWSYVRSWWSAP